MLISDGNSLIGGPLDFICILRDIRTDRFHPCFVEEKPMPGPISSVEDTLFIRAKSKMHHTTGFETFEEAVDCVKNDFSKRIVISPENIALKQAVNWDSENRAFVVLLPNWRKSKQTIDDVLSVDAIGKLN